MKYKIKHESFVFLIASLIGALLTFGSFLLTDIYSPILTIIPLGMTVVFAILYFVEQLVGTYIIVGDEAVIIKGLLTRKKILYKDIYNVNTEQYQRVRRRPDVHTDYRIRMRMGILSGKDIVLTDDASTINGVPNFIMGKRERVPDEEVLLCKACMDIRSRLKNNKASLS